MLGVCFIQLASDYFQGITKLPWILRAELRQEDVAGVNGCRTHIFGFFHSCIQNLHKVVANESRKLCFNWQLKIPSPLSPTKCFQVWPAEDAEVSMFSVHFWDLKFLKCFHPKKKQKCFPLAPSIPSFIELLCDHSWTYINIYLAGGHIQHGHTGILWIISLSHLLALRCEGNLRRHGSGTAFRALLQGLGHSSQVQGQSLHHLKRSVLENSAEPLIRFNLSICNKW